MKNRRRTIFCDIDGTIFKHQGDLYHMMKEADVLPGVIEKFLEWRENGDYIVLTTARAEGCRLTTEQQLANHGVFYDQLVMGIGNGPRLLVNDEKPDGTLTAEAVCIKRDEGLAGIDF